jgi:hypothetical protein
VSTVGTPTTAMLTASANSVSKTYTIDLGAVTTPSSLSCTSGSITGAGTDSCTVTLTAAAGSGGIPVTLASSTTAVTVPASVTVAAGATSATFTATASAVSTATVATLTATANGVSKTYAIDLGAAAPGLTVGSTTVPFGDVTLNTPSTQSVLLTSSGTETLTISAGKVSGAGFSMPGATFPMNLAPGDQASLELEFDPTTAGSATGTVTLTTNTSSGTAAINLTGTGAAPAYSVDLSWNPPVTSNLTSTLMRCCGWPTLPWSKR